MVRYWEKQLQLAVVTSFWLLGLLAMSAFGASQGLYRSSSPFIPNAVPFHHRHYAALEHHSRPAVTTFEKKIDPAVPASDASTMRKLNLLIMTLGTSSTDGNDIHHHMSKKWLRIIILTSALTVVAIAIAIFLFLWARRKRRNRKSSMLVWTNQISTLQHPEVSSSENNSCRSSARFDATKPAPWLHVDVKSKRNNCSSVSIVPCAAPYALLQAATHNFSSSNLLGEGSFGLVYKAKLDYDVNAAVKRLSHGAGSKHSQKEFQGEVDLMSKIRHPNLVALLGYSSDGPEPLVVYELMQNGSLHDQLHGPSCGTALTWCLRLKIALEAARGLEHLHTNCKPPIIHRDFKASNILLDASFNAKVSDFGLAVALEEGGLLKDDVQVQGTFGYIAPEYLMDGTLTEKSDVYGFGVVLLELLTGRLPIDASLPLGSQSLVTWVTPLLKNRAKFMEILDPGLRDSVNEKHLHQVAAVAVLCVQAEASYRPLIADVVQSLLPLVPQELGGALRDPKTKACFDNYTDSNNSKKLDYLRTGDSEVEMQSFRSDYSSVDHFPKSSVLDSSSSLGRSRSWEDDATR